MPRYGLLSHIQQRCPGPDESRPSSPDTYTLSKHRGHGSDSEDQLKSTPRPSASRANRVIMALMDAVSTKAGEEDENYFNYIDKDSVNDDGKRIESIDLAAWVRDVFRSGKGKQSDGDYGGGSIRRDTTRNGGNSEQWVAIREMKKEILETAHYLFEDEIDTDHYDSSVSRPSKNKNTHLRVLTMQEAVDANNKTVDVDDILSSSSRASGYDTPKILDQYQIHYQYCSIIVASSQTAPAHPLKQHSPDWEEHILTEGRWSADRYSALQSLLEVLERQVRYKLLGKASKVKLVPERDGVMRYSYVAPEEF